MSGASEREGTVQICVNDVWGTICDSSWGSPEAKVVCKQLGFFSFGKLVFYPFESAVHFKCTFLLNTIGATASVNAYHGRGSGPIVLDDIRCTGTESSLLQCPHDGIGIAASYCDHFDDAGVRCLGILI